MVLLRANASGDVIWTRAAAEVPACAARPPGDVLAVTGYGAVVYVDPSGEPVCRVPILPGSFAVAVATDGGALVTSNNDIVRHDVFGTVIWKKRFGGNSSSAGSRKPTEVFCAP